MFFSIITRKTGCTPLHMAAQTGHNQSARVLLFSGCNPNLKNNFGDTALHTAARYGHAGVTMILVSARAKVNQQNKNGDTALHIAAALKRRKIARLLVDAGVNCSIKNKQSEKAEDVATRKQFTDILEVISTKAVGKKRQSLGPSNQGLSPDSTTSAPPTEKKRSKLLTFFSRRNKDGESSGSGKLQQQKSFDSGCKAFSSLGSPEDLLDQFYLHQVHAKKQSQEPGTSNQPNPNSDFLRSSRHSQDFNPDQQQVKANLSSSKHKSGSRDGRSLQFTSVDSFAFDARNPKLEVFQRSERDLYVDNRFNIYYIPKGAEVLDGCVYRSRSDDTLSLGSAHRNRMPITDDEETYHDNQHATLKNRKGKRTKGSTQSVTHRAQIEPPPRASNDVYAAETRESRLFPAENGADENRVFPKENRYFEAEDESLRKQNRLFPKENGSFPNQNGSFPNQNGSFAQDDGSFVTALQPSFRTKQFLAAYEGHLGNADRDSRNPDEAQNGEFRNPPLLRRGGCCFEDVQQFQGSVKSPERSAEPDQLESLSCYPTELVPSAKLPARKNPMWNVMKSRQPLSLYLTYTYDGLDPMNNTTSV